MFGSYITDAPVLGDVDLIVEIEQKAKDHDEHWRLNAERVRLAEWRGRRFYDVADLDWGHEETLLFLRASSPYLNFHPFLDHVADAAEQRQLFP